MLRYLFFAKTTFSRAPTRAISECRRPEAVGRRPECMRVQNELGVWGGARENIEFQALLSAPESHRMALNLLNVDNKIGGKSTTYLSGTPHPCLKFLIKGSINNWKILFHIKTLEIQSLAAKFRGG